MATVSCLIPAPLQSLFGRQLLVTVYRVPLWYGFLHGFACYCSSLWIAVYGWTLSVHLCSSFYYVVSPAWLILIILGSLFPLMLFFFCFEVHTALFLVYDFVLVVLTAWSLLILIHTYILINKRKSSQSINPYYVWTWYVFPCWVTLSHRRHSRWWPFINSFKFQPCDHTPPRTHKLWILIRS